VCSQHPPHVNRHTSASSGDTRGIYHSNCHGNSSNSWK
jgi:hypothetical protein